MGIRQSQVKLNDQDKLEYKTYKRIRWNESNHQRLYDFYYPSLRNKTRIKHLYKTYMKTLQTDIHDITF